MKNLFFLYPDKIKTQTDPDYYNRLNFETIWNRTNNTKFFLFQNKKLSINLSICTMKFNNFSEKIQ